MDELLLQNMFVRICAITILFRVCVCVRTSVLVLAHTVMPALHPANNHMSVSALLMS